MCSMVCVLPCLFVVVCLVPNARGEPRPAAAARHERRLLGVGSSAMFGAARVSRAALPPQSPGSGYLRRRENLRRPRLWYPQAGAPVKRGGCYFHSQISEREFPCASTSYSKIAATLLRRDHRGDEV